MISLPRASFPSALGKGRGKWKETEGRWEKTAVLRSQERGYFPGVASWWEEEGAHVDPSVILSGASLQFQDPRKYSEHRLPPTCPPSTLNKRRHFPPRPQLRPAFSLLSFRCVQPGCVLTPEYFWGQEVAGAENSWISSENDPGPREGKKEKNLFI